jgi:hypothetical protein
VFGLSLTKILFTVLVIVAIWRAFAYIGRLQAMRQRSLGSTARADGGAPSRPRATRSPTATIDLVPCPSCGAYVPRGEACRCRRRA